MDNSLMIRHAARMVRSIAAGQWTNDPPEWADDYRYEGIAAETRAVQTAEAFILLFSKFDPTFNEASFLRACKLR